MHLLLLTERPFRAFRHGNTLRIHGKHSIDKLWHSFIDVQMPRNIKAVKTYLFKDMLKQYNRTHKSDQDYMTLALNWIFHTQSYSISGWDESDDLIEKSIIQTQAQEFYREHKHRDIEFLGLVHLNFPCLDKPPSEFTLQPSEEEFRELEECIFKRPGNENRSTHVVKTCSCGLIVGLDSWDFDKHICKYCSMHDTFEFRKAEDLRHKLPEVARLYREEAEQQLIKSIIKELFADEKKLSSRNQERGNMQATPKGLLGQVLRPTIS